MDEEAEILRILLFYPKRFSENRQCNNCGGVGSPGCAVREGGSGEGGEAMGRERWGGKGARRRGGKGTAPRDTAGG